MIKRALFIAAVAAVVHQAWAQGEDSLPSERDLAVIATMLPGIYDNNNQTYFEGRTGVDETLRHARRRIDIEDLPEPAAAFDVRLSTPGDNTASEPTMLRAQLGHDDALGQVTMTLTGDDGAPCRYTWSREPQQFRAQRAGACPDDMPQSIILGQQQLWWYPSAEGAGALEFHRARQFECYVDMPGVGGGRDIPYTRYDGIVLHDRGATHWFMTDEDPSREIGITLWQVDWPINNYKGVFTRDSLVIYVSEKVDEGSKEHGYAFVEPDAERVGINLKWLLATCFMESNSVTRPSM